MFENVKKKINPDALTYWIREAKYHGWITSDGSLAAKVGVSGTAIDLYRHGKRNPNEKTVALIAKALKINVSQLYEPPPKTKPISESEINKLTAKLLDKAHELLGDDNPRALRIAFDIAKQILPDAEVEPDTEEVDEEERTDIDKELDKMLAGGE